MVSNNGIEIQEEEGLVKDDSLLKKERLISENLASLEFFLILEELSKSIGMKFLRNKASGEDSEKYQDLLDYIEKHEGDFKSLCLSNKNVSDFYQGINSVGIDLHESIKQKPFLGRPFSETMGNIEEVSKSALSVSKKDDMDDIAHDIKSSAGTVMYVCREILRHLNLFVDKYLSEKNSGFSEEEYVGFSDAMNLLNLNYVLTQLSPSDPVYDIINSENEISKNFWRFVREKLADEDLGDFGADVMIRTFKNVSLQIVATDKLALKCDAILRSDKKGACASLTLVESKESNKKLEPFFPHVGVREAAQNRPNGDITWTCRRLKKAVIGCENFFKSEIVRGLIDNGIRAAKDAAKRILVEVDTSDPEYTKIKISNCGKLPEGFDIDTAGLNPVGTGHGLKTTKRELIDWGGNLEATEEIIDGETWTTFTVTLKNAY